MLVDPSLPELNSADDSSNDAAFLYGRIIRPEPLSGLASWGLLTKTWAGYTLPCSDSF